MIKSHKATNENTGDEQGVQHLVQQLEQPDTQTETFPAARFELLAAAEKSIKQSRLAVEKLLDAISCEDSYTIGIVGPILSVLRDAERVMGQM